MNKIKTIGIVALAGGDISPVSIDNAKSFFELSGYNVKLSENLASNYRYLAGTDDERLESLYSMFLDKDVDLIMNARGGYGSIRFIKNIDYEIIKSNPKPFCGFSDITALLLMLYKHAGLITYHAPMAVSDFGEKSCSIFTLQNFEKAINGNTIEIHGDKIYKTGKARGIIWGGNLSTVVSLCGQDFIPDEDFIFFAEDLNEPVYKIDKMFTQLFNIERFNHRCKGIVLGDFLNVDNESWLKDLFHEFRVPTAGGFKITHARDKITLPIGKLADFYDGKLVIE
jgi:muramoyltetrapeptide carboxypeptidase